MKVYRMSSDVNGYEALMATYPQDRETLRFLWIQTQVVPPKPILLECADDEELLPSGDFPHVVHGIPVFSQRGWHVLGPLLAEYGEVISFLHKQTPYFGLRLTHILAALDLDQSVLETFEGSVMGVERYAFIPQAVDQSLIFKVPQCVTEVFVQEPVVKVAQEKGLVGILFDLVWEA